MFTMLLRWMENATIRYKLLILAVIFSIGMLFLGYTGYRNSNLINIKLESIFLKRMPAMCFLFEADRDLQQLLVAERSMIFADKNFEVFSKLKDEYNSNLEQAKRRLSKYEKLATTDKEKNIIEKFKTAFSEWENISRRVYNNCNNKKQKEVDLNTIKLSLGKAKKHFEEARGYIDQLQELNYKIVENNHSTAKNIFRDIIFQIILTLTIILALGILFSMAISGSITKPINSTITAMKNIAEGEGDLTQRVKLNSYNEIGQLVRWFNTFLNKIQENIKQVGNCTEKLGSSSDNLSNISNHMKDNAEKTAIKLDEASGGTQDISDNVRNVASAMEEMTASISEIGKNTSEAAQIASTAVEESNNAAGTITRLGTSGQEIGNVIQVITAIAEQTNLLALNATIEASRAGEAGKGFAVVANEVKELAKQTAKATDDIGQKIVTIQNDTKDAVLAIEKISSIISQVDSAQTTIAGAVEQQSATSNEIAGNISDAAKLIQNIAAILEEVAEVSKDTANGANNTDDAAHELASLSKELKNMLANFKY